MKSYWIEAIILAAIYKEKQGDYPYNINNKIMSLISMSESTTYQICKRMVEKQYLVELKRNFNGRLRKYYCITDKGIEQLAVYKIKWAEFSSKIDKIMN
jgi:PadR family transcriptional regulator PadR